MALTRSTKNFLCFFALGLVLPPVLLVSYGYFLLGRPNERNALYAELEVKSAIALAKHRKVEILSGSNGLYGFSARQMEQQYGVPAVNMADHAGLGLDYILYRGQQVVGPGDLVVLPLEYELYGEDKPAGDFVTLQVLLHDKRYWEQEGWRSYAQMLLSVRLGLWISLILHEHSSASTTGAETNSLNGWGDTTQGSDNEVIKAALSTFRAEKPISFTCSDAALERIVDFKQNVQQRGASVVVVFPNMLYRHMNVHSPQFVASIAQLRARLAERGIPLLGEPGDFLFDDSAAYDSVYHRNAATRKLSTDRLMALIRGYIPLGDL